MRNRLTHNWGLKLISLGLAILIWLVIIYTYDPADTADFTLKVDVLNEDAITSLDKIYEVIEGDTVTIRVKGNTSLVNSLKASDFKATADISKLSPTYHASIRVECTKTNNVEISFLGDVNLLAIQLEDVAEKQFKVSVMPKGEPAEGYYVGNSTTKPNLIQVRGAKSAVERIDEVRVVVDVNGADSQIKAEVAPKAYDAAGNEITTGRLTYSRESIEVTTTIYGTREIPIEVVTTGKAYDGYRMTSLDFEPKSVRVAGTEEELAKLTSIQIPVSVANRITDLEDTFLLDDYMPETVHLTDPEASVNVFAKVERLATRIFDVPYSSIYLSNASHEMWQYRMLQNGKFKVKVRGLQEDLDLLKLSALRPYVDLSVLNEAGEFYLNIQFELAEEFDVQGIATVAIMVAPQPGMSTEEPEIGEDGEPVEGEVNEDGENITEEPVEDGNVENLEGTGSNTSSDNQENE